MHGIKYRLWKFGEALILEAYMNGVPVFGEFGSLEGLQAWVADNAHSLDAEDTVNLNKGELK